MKLVIELENGQPLNHPLLWENFLQHFPDADWDNLPEGYAKFERVRQNTPLFHNYDGVTYEWDGDIIKDVHHYTPMTEEERQEYINIMRKLPHPENFIFNETTCRWEENPV